MPSPSIPCPTEFAVRPDQIEFWQGQAARLHDRFRYERTNEGWRLERLAP